MRTRMKIFNVHGGNGHAGTPYLSAIRGRGQKGKAVFNRRERSEGRRFGGFDARSAFGMRVHLGAALGRRGGGWRSEIRKKMRTSNVERSAFGADTGYGILARKLAGYGEGNTGYGIKVANIEHRTPNIELRT